MKILVTGANGFVGKELSKLLSDKHDVYAHQGRSDVDLTKFNKADKLLDNNFDIVVHCATAGRYDHLSSSKSILHANMKMFTNLYHNRRKFKKLINIGSGAEFDLTTDIVNIDEDKIFEATPESSYGLSKNFISRIVSATDNFYTLRLFGCVGTSPAEGTLFHKLINNSSKHFSVTDDRYFDFFNLIDLAKVVEHVSTNTMYAKDLNMVYDTKFKLSEVLTKYCKIHKLKTSITVSTTSHLNYTGNSSRLNTLNIKLDGLDAALKDCK